MAEGTEVQLNDAQVFEKLSKELGRPIASYADLAAPPPPPAPPTPEEIEKQKQERESSKVAWALSNNKVDKAVYDKYVQVGGNPEAVVYGRFLANKQSEDPNVNVEEVQREFNDIKEALGEKFIKNIGDAVINNEYGSILNLENEFTEFETTEKKLKTEGPQFVEMASNLVNTLGAGFEIEVLGADGQAPIKLKYTPDSEKVKALLQTLTTPDHVAKNVKKGFTKEAQEAIIRSSLINSDLPAFAKQIYDQAVFNKEALFRGIPTGTFVPAPVMTPGENEKRIEENQNILKQVQQARKDGVPLS